LQARPGAAVDEAMRRRAATEEFTAELRVGKQLFTVAARPLDGVDGGSPGPAGALIFRPA